MYHGVFIHLSIDRQLGCFLLFAVVDRSRKSVHGRRHFQVSDMVLTQLTASENHNRCEQPRWEPASSPLDHYKGGTELAISKATGVRLENRLTCTVHL